MTLKDTIHADMVASLKARNKVAVGALRSVLGAITEAEASGKTRHELNDSDVVNIVRKQVKQREDSATTYEDAGRESLAVIEREEAEILVTYLPTMLSEDAVRDLVVNIIADNSLTSPRDMGKVMSALSKVEGVDKGIAAKIAKEELVK